MSRQVSNKVQKERINAEIERLLGILRDIPEEKLKVAKSMIERVAFMTVTLQILEEDIINKGPTYPFVQGSQKMIVENPSQKSYNTMINRYTTAYSKLMDLLPKNEVVDQMDDGFDEFVDGGGDD